MLFLDGVADRAPLHILFAICKRYFFGNNGIARPLKSLAKSKVGAMTQVPSSPT